MPSIEVTLEMFDNLHSISGPSECGSTTILLVSLGPLVVARLSPSRLDLSCSVDVWEECVPLLTSPSLGDDIDHPLNVHSSSSPLIIHCST